MISVSQDKNTFYYVHWIPSEQGPLVLDYGKEIIKDDLNDLYYNALNAIRMKIKDDNHIFSISLDSKIVLFSQTSIEDEFDHFDVLNWFNDQTIGNQTDGDNETFHYSFTKKQRMYLNVHFKSQIKDSIKRFAQDYNSEIRNLGLGIFSAEIAARCIYNADYHKKYAVLKIAQDCELLIVSGGELVSFLNFNIKEKKIILNVNYGDVVESKKILKDLEIIISNKDNKIKSVDHLYYYKGKGKFKVIENLLKFKKVNATSLNIFSKLKFNENQKIIDVDAMQYAEIGASFWGIDV